MLRSLLCQADTHISNLTGRSGDDPYLKLACHSEECSDEESRPFARAKEKTACQLTEDQTVFKPVVSAYIICMLVLPVQRSGYQAAGGPQVNFACFYGLRCRLHRWVTPISCIIYTTGQKPCQDFFVNTTYISLHPFVEKWLIRQI